VAHIRLELEQSGGFGGLSTRSALDTADLPPEAAAEIEKLVDAAERAPVPAPPPRPVPDAGHYELTIVRDGRTRRLSFDDPTVPSEVRSLLARVASEGRRA
jgi:emfourin